jgi:hypothetical protein
LTAEQIQLLTRWINEGAKAPNEAIPPNPSQHWSFQPLIRPPLPPPKLGVDPNDPNTEWIINNIDAFVAAEHQRSGLAPTRTTAKGILLRRIYLDLIGLPPTRAELQEFLADTSPQAYERAVDRLLERPQYGERWGRHWMDVWRYSDWAGFGNEIRYSQRHVWRWRDWIIESLNDDKGYDQMVREMLAADELPAPNDDTIRATGFLARNWYKFDRNVWLDDVVEHSGKAFLGMTFKCARCHDHKYDPISQREYYRLRAIFEPYDVRTDRVPGEADINKNGLARVYDAKPDALTYFFERGDPNRADKEHPLEPNVPKVILDKFKIQPVELPAESYYPAIRAHVSEDLIASAEKAVAAAKQNLLTANQQLAAVEATKKQSEKPSDEPAVVTPTVDPPTPANQKEVVFLDSDFSKLGLEAWKSVRGDWQQADGHLEQKQIVAAFSPLATIANHPADFVASVELKPTGGAVFRSVGFSFDWIADRDFQAVYLSAKNGASTVSAFHRRGGKDAYPGEAVVPHPIKVGQQAKLEVKVRGDILNLFVDGELKLAYRLPAPRQAGKFAIWTYDASAEFYRVRITELPKDAKLAPPSTPSVVPSKPAAQKLTPESATRAVELAKKKISTAEAKLTATVARIAAERAKYQIESALGTSVAERAKAAARAELLAKLAEADEKLLLAKQTSIQAKELAKLIKDEKTKKSADAAEKKLAAAQTAFENAEQASKKESTNYSPLGTSYPKTSTGRRLAFAQWIVDRQNPLAARVAVNHIWLRHFGTPLVERVDDFGLRSPRPKFADLLDYLSVELMENKWSMKHIHRLIMTSRTYRMSTSPTSREPLEKDPGNKSLWRMNSQRMEAEMIRDSILHLAGSLDLQRGGPDIDHKQGMTVSRRSLYFRHARERQMKFLMLFDPANPRECYRRQASIRPQQAYGLINSPLAIGQSRKLAALLKKQMGETNDDDSFITVAFETILSRQPSVPEANLSRQFLLDQTKELSDPAKLELLSSETNAVPAATDPAQRARENLVLVLFNNHDFVTIR